MSTCDVLWHSITSHRYITLNSMMGVQALEVQITGAFAEHEARLGQQQEALARQSQKGLSTMQTRINALQATLAADSAQHAAAYADVQRQNERLQHDKESAYAKGDPSFSVRHTPSIACICLLFVRALTSSGRNHRGPKCTTSYC